jgi:hypothetical protein
MQDKLMQAQTQPFSKLAQGNTEPFTRFSSSPDMAAQATNLFQQLVESAMNLMQSAAVVQAA